MITCRSTDQSVQRQRPAVNVPPLERPRAQLILPNRERDLRISAVTLPQAVCALSQNTHLSDGGKRRPPKDSIINSGPSIFCHSCIVLSINQSFTCEMQIGTVPVFVLSSVRRKISGGNRRFWPELIALGHGARGIPQQHPTDQNSHHIQAASQSILQNDSF